jgi:hypothetical protein
MKHTTLISRAVGTLVLFSGIALCACAADIQERTLLYPTVLTSAPNILKDAEWRLPVGDSKEYTVERLKGSPFSDEAPAWHIRLTAPEGAYWRAYPNVQTGRKYLFGAWLRVDNANILLRAYCNRVSDGTLYDQRLYCYGGFNAYLLPYLSARMAKKLVGNPNEWKLCYRILTFPEAVKGDRFCAAMGVYLSTGAMTFAEPFLIDITDSSERSLTIDVCGTRPFRRLSVIATGLGDIVWSKEFPEPVTSYKGVVPAELADFERGQGEDVIEGHTLEVTYVDGSVGMAHSPQEKIFTKRK